MFKTTSIGEAAREAILADVGFRSGGDTLLQATLRYLAVDAVCIKGVVSDSVIKGLKQNPKSYIRIGKRRYDYKDLYHLAMEFRRKLRRKFGVVVDCRTYEGQPHRDMQPNQVQLAIS